MWRAVGAIMHKYQNVLLIIKIYFLLKLFLLLVSSVCKVKGMLSLQKSRIGEALCWAIRGQDSAFATHLGDLYLKEYVKDGSFACPDILDNLGSIVVTCDRFMFIGKY